MRGAHKQSLRPLLLPGTARQLHKEHYDLALNVRLKSWWISALFYLAGVPRRAGFASDLNSPFLTHALAVHGNEHLSVASLHLLSAGLQALGYPPLAKPYTPQRYPSSFRPTDRTTEEEQRWARQRLYREGIEPGAFPPDGNHSRAAPAGRDRTSDHCAYRHADGRVAWGQLAAAFQQAQLVLGVDSGPLHLGVALGIPTVRIYGPSTRASLARGEAGSSIE